MEERACAPTRFIDTFRNPGTFSLKPAPFEAACKAQRMGTGIIAYYEFFAGQPKRCFGHLHLALDQAKALPEMKIVSLGTKEAGEDSVIEGAGREILRRLVVFTAQKGLIEIVTSPMTSGAAGFWFRMGFLPKGHYTLCWSSPAAAPWKEEVEKDISALWSLADSLKGRAALWSYEGTGVLNLNDPVQRLRCANALQVDEAMIVPRRPISACKIEGRILSAA